jgi:hypothetical protein
MHSSADHDGGGSSQFPVVVQVGFAGARYLVDRKAHPEMNDQAVGRFEQAVTEQLTKILQSEILTKIGAQGEAFFCGISQVAIGGDFAFSRACEQLGWVQRVFIPQHRDAYLAALGSGGPDFTEVQRKEALDILSRAYVIQERRVSESNNRHERFEEANIEIARVADVLVALRRKDQIDKPGGTHQLAELAKRRDIPLLQVVVDVNEDGSPNVAHEWTGSNPAIPRLPPLQIANSESKVLWTPDNAAKPNIPNAAAIVDHLKSLGSAHASWKQRFFKRLALVILGTHLLATMLAVFALMPDVGPWLAWFLGLEIILLVTGFAVHLRLHQSRAVEDWAKFRLLAEIARSVQGVGSSHIYLRHLFALPLPASFLPLMRTLSVLHLHATRSSVVSWQKQRDDYVDRRLKNLKFGQIAYHRSNSLRARGQRQWAQRLFFFASGLAIAATTFKLVAVLGLLPHDLPAIKGLKSTAGFLAVLLPVLAVAALSLAAAFDLHAKEQTSADMLKFLERQATHLERAGSAGEFRRLLLQTEAQLLGETANWYARRAFVSVA